MYYIVFAIWYLFSLLPLWVHYLISDALYLFIYKIAGYRTAVVRKNLSSSFPNKSEEELRDIEHRFYHWFCDYMVETVKMFSMSEKQIKRRMRFEGIEQINNDLKKQRSITVYLGHYCNWEWVCSLGLHITEGTAAQLYHPLESKLFDRLFLYSHSVTGYISDQVPGFSSMHYWPWFLNHDTPTYTGAERIARILNTSVYYFDIERPRRGYYVVKVVKICDNTKELPKFAITEQYYRLLETSIIRHPEFWLWSHNRWKRTREQFIEYFPDETERKRILSKL